MTIVVASSGSDLTDGQRCQLFEVLLEFADMFAADSTDLGHTVQLDATPIRQSARRVPFVHRDKIEGHGKQEGNSTI